MYISTPAGSVVIITGGYELYEGEGFSMQVFDGRTENSEHEGCVVQFNDKEGFTLNLLELDHEDLIYPKLIAGYCDDYIGKMEEEVKNNEIENAITEAGL